MKMEWWVVTQSGERVNGPFSSPIPAYMNLATHPSCRVECVERVRGTLKDAERRTK